MSDTPQNIITFPKSAPRKVNALSVRRPASLPGFRVVTGETPKMTNLRDLHIDKVFDLDWTAPLVIEFDDPKQSGKRDINLRMLQHEGRTYRVRWMNRGMNPGKKTYGLFAI